MFNSTWYNALVKPPLAPPDWVFAPAWAFLYLTMVLALILYVFPRYRGKARGYIYFSLQLFLNFLWSPAFFILKNIALALFIIAFLDIFVFLTIKEFYRVSRMASYLFLPYFAWIIYATYLNIGYLILN